jgi:hypothetical protein
MTGTFDEAFRAEVEGWVNPRRLARQAAPADPGLISAVNGLYGLALSGGGMRSASFSLGVLQALARRGLLAEVDYMSTVSGGGYTGTSLTSLCAEPLPYPPSGARLGFNGTDFPYAFPGPRRASPAAGSSAPTDDLESPALRHVRRNANLLTRSPGLLDAETWTGGVRYAVSTVLTWVLYLLPLVTLGYLASMLIPAEAWNRTDPLNIHGGAATWISTNPWVLTAPLWPLVLVAFLALTPAWGRRWPEAFMARPVQYVQQGLLLLAAVLGGAVLLMLGVWGLHEGLSIEGGLQALVKALLAAAGLGGGAAAGASARSLSLPRTATKFLPQVGLAVGGYLLLGIAAVVWYYFLWRWAYQDWPVFWSVLGAASALYLIATLSGVGLLNWLSIHRLYEQRIRRTWVIAAVPPVRRPREAGISGGAWRDTWVRPDLKIGRLADTQGSSSSPYPLWITALNMPGSTGAAQLDRKSDGFVIAPLYCGSGVTGWRGTRDTPAFADMRLSTAATISGAAVSPNMGMTTHATLAVVMTLFNVRLGMWVTNPRAPRTAMERAIGVLHRVFGLYWNELVGRASHRGPWVYLSDGGHFENLGIYELLRRRCKYIIAVDATGEPAGKGPLNFGAIGIPLRLARIDFGVEVRLDLSGLERDPQTGLAKSPFAVGRIRYPKAGGGHGNPDDPGDVDTGYLVIIKSGLVRDADLVRDRIPADVINYLRQENPGFPYDSTLDQQFSQPQFESYRQLGFIAGNQVAEVVKTATTGVPKPGAVPGIHDRFAALDATYRAKLASWAPEGRR